MRARLAKGLQMAIATLKLRGTRPSAMATLVEVSPPHGGVPGVGPHGTMGSSGGGVELLVPKHTAARSHSKWRRIDAAGDNSALQARIRPVLAGTRGCVLLGVPQLTPRARVASGGQARSRAALCRAAP